MIQSAITDRLTMFVAAAAGMVALPASEKLEIFRIGLEQSQIIVQSKSEAAITGRAEVMHICMAASDVVALAIDHVCGITDKPVLLADTNTMTLRLKKDQVDTTEYEKSAGEHTMEYYLDAVSSRYCIGIHRCTVRDYQPWNTQYHRRGLLKADDSPYFILVDYTRKTNGQVYELVYSSKEENPT